MKTRIGLALVLVAALALVGAAMTLAVQAGAHAAATPARPQGPCDIYAAAGATNLNVAAVTDFSAGQTVLIDADGELETAVIASVGTPGASTQTAATEAGVSVIPVASAFGFSAGQDLTIDSGAAQETVTVVSTTSSRSGSTITVSKPLAQAHDAGAQVSGSGITLAAPLGKPHLRGAQVARSLPTPGAPNRYFQSK